MGGTIVFIHGMFLTPKSWDGWRLFFTARGYLCLAPAWPWHDGEPTALREHVPAETGHVSLKDVVDEFAAVVAALPEKPILIGHSVGGLVVQVLVNRGVARAGVCISSVAPNGIITLDWDFLRAGAAIANPFTGDRPYRMTEMEFRRRFGNTMTEAQSRAAYSEYAVHESRNVLRGCLGPAGRVDLKREHAPLLFVAGNKDRLFPEELEKENARAYAPGAGVADFKEFPGRGHFIHGEPGWQEVAAYVDGWLAAEPWDAARRFTGARGFAGG